MDWNQLQEIVSELDLADQVRFAELKGIEVPEDVLTEVAGELAQDEAKKALNSHLNFIFGTEGQPDRVYLSTKGLAVSNDGGKTQRAKSLYVETRGIDEVLAIFTAAKAICVDRGIPTTPSAGKRNAGLDAEPREGDKRA